MSLFFFSKIITAKETKGEHLSLPWHPHLLNHDVRRWRSFSGEGKRI